MRALGLIVALLLGALSFGQEAGQEAEVLSAMRSRVLAQNDVWFREGEFPKIIRSLEVWTRVLPRDYEAASNLTHMLFSTKRLDEEIAWGLWYARMNPDDPDGTLIVAATYFRMRLYWLVPGVAEAKIAGERKPHQNLYRFLANSYARMGMVRESLRVWEAALVVYPEMPGAVVNRDRMRGLLKSGS